MSKENKLLETFTKFMVEHDIECEEDLYQDESIDRDSFELIEDLFNVVKSKNIKKDGKQTNADRIRNMSDEELAELILCPHMVNWGKGIYDVCIHPKNGKDECKKCMLEWLQSEAE